LGTVLRFHPRGEDAVAKTEAILTKIGQHYQQRCRAKVDLPAVLAQLVHAGETDLVLRAVALWGSGEMEAHEVLSMCEEAAAVAGIKPVGDRPFTDCE